MSTKGKNNYKSSQYLFFLINERCLINGIAIYTHAYCMHLTACSVYMYVYMHCMCLTYLPTVVAVTGNRPSPLPDDSMTSSSSVFVVLLQSNNPLQLAEQISSSTHKMAA